MTPNYVILFEAEDEVTPPRYLACVALSTTSLKLHEFIENAKRHLSTLYFVYNVFPDQPIRAAIDQSVDRSLVKWLNSINQVQSLTEIMETCPLYNIDTVFLLYKEKTGDWYIYQPISETRQFRRMIWDESTYRYRYN